MKLNFKRFIVICSAICFCVVNLCNPMVAYAEKVYGYGYYFRTKYIPKYTSYYFYLGSGYSNTAIPAIRNAIATMNHNSKFHLSFSEASREANTADEICTIGTELSDGVMSALYGSGICMATVFSRGAAGKIKASDIFVNQSYGWSYSTSASAYDYQGAFTHELGHALGLWDMYGDYYGDYDDYVNFRKWFATDESLPTMYGLSTYKDMNKKVYAHLRTLESGDCNGLDYVYKLVVCG